MPSSQIISMASELIQLREEKDEKKKEASKARDAFDLLKANLYVLMDNEDVKSFAIDGLGRFTKTMKAFTKVLDKDKLYKYLEGEGLADSIFSTEPKKERLNEFIKDNFIEEEKPIPEIEMGIVITGTPNISIRAK